MYGMNNYGKLFADDINNCLIYVLSVKKSQGQMYIYHKYAPVRSKLFVLSFVYDCVYWYTYEELEKWFVNSLVKRFHINFLGYSH